MASQLCISALVLLCGVSAAGAQEPRFVYPSPPATSYHLTKDVQYGTSTSGSLRMDVYRPAPATRGPVLIFLNSASGPGRAHPFYVAWATLAASKGVTAIVPDLGMDTFATDFASLIAHLSRLSDDPTIDRDAIAVYAGSGNVWRALPIVQDPKLTSVKSAVMYYGAATVTQFRTDLPMLLVRAGLDRPELNRAIDTLASSAVAQNAPITLLNHRDLGLPAARACIQKGDPEAAIAWLRSIPRRFLPREIEKDPVFASIQDRPDFKALFSGR